MLKIWYLQPRKPENIKADIMKILIGYFMRNGSALLQRILSEHSQLCVYSDLSSFAAFAGLRLGLEHNRRHRHRRA